MEHQFAFLIHPFDRRDITRKLPALAALPDPTLDRLLRHLPPLLVDRIDGVTGAQGVKTSGWLVGTPLTSQQLLELPWPVVYRKLLAAGKKAVRLGAKVLGLGAFTAVAGDAGVSLARRLPIAVTTGNSYTVAIALKAADVGARWMGWDPDRAGWVVMGATGAWGGCRWRSLPPGVGRCSPMCGTIARRASFWSIFANGVWKAELSWIMMCAASYPGRRW
ncbi:hypothetical protein [Kyrpidia spormannii]|uniref:Uncharacterized protein n=1 Tax=Kyrpidia spormannii TaxID=2055160 RepID=A0ACA8Z6P1_9BACL|nr:hypothetical protein [Kyrpidia spormannii]CAB3390837.1 protein of unknown function [Kyrpidia spormannii]